MKATFEQIPLVKNEEKKRFEIQVDGHFAFIDYKENSRKIALIHTEADAALAGTGAAAAVVEKTLHYIQQDGRLLLPYCPYVFAYLRKHPTWKTIVDPTFPSYDQL